MPPVVGADRDRALRVLCLGLVAFWLSLAVVPARLWPLGPAPNIQGLVAEVKAAPRWILEMVPQLQGQEAPLVAKLQREAALIIALTWGLIALGVTGAILTARGWATGRWLTLLLCGWILLRVAASEILWRPRLWLPVARISPGFAGRLLLDLVVPAATIVYLAIRMARRPVG